MHFSEYQKVAQKTDQMPFRETGSKEERMKALMLPLLGLAGESGTLLTHFKRYIRDGEAYSFFNQRVQEELGDILWNVANIATKANLDLDKVAARNLKKIGDRWHGQKDATHGPKLFDEGLLPNEQFPRRFEIKVESRRDATGKPHAQLYYQDREFGNDLTDNAEEDDGYRLHDIFHLGFLAVLGWSPVLRGKAFFNCKRKSDPSIDEIQDGGRSAVIDEAIAALVFIEGQKNSYFEGVKSVEYSLLRTIKDLTSHLEVSQRSGKEWEKAILTSFKVWRELKASKEGVIRVDLRARSIKFIAPTRRKK